MTFPLFTSIKPPADADELSYLRDCLRSWRMAGFDTIAVNGPSEIEALRKHDLPVQFSAAPTDGKPRIGAILSAIRETGARFAGIINSDCRIVPYPNFAHRLQKSLDGRAAIAWRLDVGEGDPKAYPHGFDAFFFDTTVMPEDDCGFSIGETWWDLWFPLDCERRGVPIGVIEMPLLLHTDHPPNWSESQWLDNGKRLWLSLGRRGDPSGGELAKWSFDIPSRLRKQRHTVGITPEIETALNFASRAMFDVTTRSAAPEAAELTRLRSEKEQLQAELAAMRNTTSWRMTAPLRTAVGMARRLQLNRRPELAS
jgi:hypothetical protein